MDNLKALRPFHRRIQKEAVLRALCCALAIVLAALALLYAAANVQRLSMPSPGAVCAGSSVLFLLALGGAYFLFRPTLKQTGRRLDDLGLGDRVSTMIAFHQDTSAICALQREDTLAHLKTLSPSALRIRFPRAWMIACLCLFVTLSVILLLPQEAWTVFQPNSVESPVAVDTEEMEAIRAILQSVADQIDTANLSEAEKEALRARLREIMDKLAEDGEMGLTDLAAAISDSEILTSDIADLERVNTIVGELLKTRLLRDVALALSAQDERMIRDAMYSLQSQFLSLYDAERQRLLEQAAGEIQTALSNVPGADKATLSSDYLSYCFARFADELLMAAKGISVGMDGADQIEEAVLAMIERLTTLVSDEENGAEKKAILSKMMSQEAETPGDEQQSAAEGENSGFSFGGQLATTGTEGTAWGLDEERERYYTIDTVYEPTMDPTMDSSAYIPGKKKPDGTVQRQVIQTGDSLQGTVPYQQVYGIYYARLLEQMDTLDADVLDKVKAYFYGLLQREGYQPPED